jgi:hypothetical protein
MYGPTVGAPSLGLPEETSLYLELHALLGGWKYATSEANICMERKFRWGMVMRTSSSGGAGINIGGTEGG